MCIFAFLNAHSVCVHVHIRKFACFSKCGMQSKRKKGYKRRFGSESNEKDVTWQLPTSERCCILVALMYPNLA